MIIGTTPLSTTGRVFVHTKVQVPREDYVTTASKSASKLKTKKSDASSIAPSRSATTVVDEKFDAVAIIVDCLRRCIGARAWEATAPLLDALTWLSSFAASEFTNGRDIVGSRILPGSELMMTLVASRHTVPTAKAKTREEEMPSSGVISGGNNSDATTDNDDVLVELLLKTNCTARNANGVPVSHHDVIYM